MGKQVKVVTKCGETFTYNHDQEVETVEIIDSNIIVNGSTISFTEVPEYICFQLYDRKGGRVVDFHLATSGHGQKNEIYFAGGYTVKERGK